MAVSCVFTAKANMENGVFRKKCDIGLCVVNCFETWHTRVNLSHMTQRVALTVVA